MKGRVHRIADCNRSLYAPDKHLSFEASFYVAEDTSLIFLVKIIDSQDTIVLRNGDLREYSESTLKIYQNWNPIDDFQQFCSDFETQDISTDAIVFFGPMAEVSLEIEGPIADPQVYGVIVNMPEFILMDNYQPKDTGAISVSLLCKKQDISQMLADLYSNLQDCIAQREEMVLSRKS
ncbi:hypothetical protein [Pseudanabaena sp. PCC 6802]|uniref:hypothetical protein n=1 Tax=Pseudanabaena sp. PCC 6802 TaxID=118173 RepID=UPI0003746418|nr:hypothetical protein [Pseudanabaena sp. PCC 6802]